MNRFNVLFLVVGAYAAFDLIRTLRTGRAHGRWSGTINARAATQAVLRYVYAGCVVLCVLLGRLHLATLWPDSLNRH